jgi:hypothetical protein
VIRPDALSLSVRLRAPRPAAIAGILFSVLLIATSTLALRTHFIPRWIALLGYGLALLLLLCSRSMDQILVVFPLWVLLISLYILIDNLRNALPPTAATREQDLGV